MLAPDVQTWVPVMKVVLLPDRCGSVGVILGVIPRRKRLPV